MYFQSHDNTVILISRIKATFIVINIVNPAIIVIIIVSNSRGKFCQLEQILCLALVDPVISTCVRLHIIQRYEHHTRAYKIMQTLMVKLKS